MTSQGITTTQNAAGQWEVRCNDGEQTLLGTFPTPALREIFLEALRGLVGRADHNIMPAEGSGRSHQLFAA